MTPAADATRPEVDDGIRLDRLAEWLISAIALEANPKPSNCWAPDGW